MENTSPLGFIVSCTFINKFQKRSQASGGKSGMPRTVFSRKQLAKLEERFVQQTFLSKEERLELAESLKLTDRQVMVWFQNRRWVKIPDILL